MNPIIHPAWFYLIHIANAIHGLCFVVLMISAVGLIMVIANVDELDSAKKWIKLCIIVAVIISLMIILVPDEKTIYMMLAASVVTPDNISGGEEHIVNLIANIVNAVNNTAK